jgi:hypothetical protein
MSVQQLLMLHATIPSGRQPKQVIGPCAVTFFSPIIVTLNKPDKRKVFDPGHATSNELPMK